MTNRKDMIDEALLRPGRLEVQIEISLPDEEGRLQILKIHTTPMREAKCLGQDVHLPQLATETKNFSVRLHRRSAIPIDPLQPKRQEGIQTNSYVPLGRRGQRLRALSRAPLRSPSIDI